MGNWNSIGMGGVLHKALANRFNMELVRDVRMKLNAGLSKELRRGVCEGLNVEFDNELGWELEWELETELI